MANIEGTKRIQQQATLLLPPRKELVVIEGDDGEPIEGTDE